MKSIFAASCLAATALGYASFTITEDGVEKTLYAALGSSLSSGSSLVMNQNERGTWLTADSMSPENIYTPNLWGSTIEYTWNLSESNCGCISTIYLVSAPGKDSSGNYWDTDGQYYCDGNCITGNWCPEFDLAEANQYVWATTPHSCNAPNNGFYSYCNQGGDCNGGGINSASAIGANDFGPGGQYKIDSTQDFQVKHKLGDDGSFTTEWSQNGNTVSMGGSCSGGMEEPLSRGMSFIVSTWSAYDADWLVQGKCQQSACNLGTLTFKDISITTGTGGGGGGGGGGDYTYGDACASSYDDDCDGCSSCSWSWPSSSDWNDPNAKCRCK